MHPSIKKVGYSAEIERTLAKWKKKDKNLFSQVAKQIEKVFREPTLGKPFGTL